QLLVEATERRTAIAGDETRRVEAGEAVTLALHEEHAHHRLRARDEDPLLGKIVFVVERDVMKRHMPSPRRAMPSGGLPPCGMFPGQSFARFAQGQTKSQPAANAAASRSGAERAHFWEEARDRETFAEHEVVLEQAEITQQRINGRLALPVIDLFAVGGHQHLPVDDAETLVHRTEETGVIG